MNASASHARVRLSQVLYAAVLVLVAASDGRLLRGYAALLAQAVGFVVVVAAVLGRLWATLFIAGRKDLELVRAGPYSICRHPLYGCSIIAAFGIGLTTLSLTLSIALPLVVAALVVAAARREDVALLASHGADWRAYQASVPAFLPAWSMSRSPEVIPVPPRIYRKALFDAASFLGLWLLVLLLEYLRAAGAWPALFRLV